MYTAEKVEALRRLYARVHSAIFTRDEVESFRSNGITLSEIIDRGYLDESSVAEGQKTVITLMSRRPLDDINDLLIWYYRDSTGDVVLRRYLGVSGKDEFMEKLADLPSKISGFVSDAAALIGLNDKNNDRKGWDPLSELTITGTDFNGEYLEAAIPLQSLNMSAVDFLKLISQDGSPAWNRV